MHYFTSFKGGLLKKYSPKFEYFYKDDYYDDYFY